MGKNGTPENSAVIKAVKVDNVMKEARATSLVITGVKESTRTVTNDICEDDVTEVKRIMEAIEKNVQVKKVYRIKRKPGHDNATIKAKESAARPAALVVELENEVAKKKVLSGAHKLAGTENFVTEERLHTT